MNYGAEHLTAEVKALLKYNDTNDCHNYTRIPTINTHRPVWIENSLQPYTPIAYYNQKEHSTPHCSTLSSIS